MHANETEFITLTQAANASPGRPSTNCVWRWCRKGVKSRNGQTLRLQHVRMGGKMFTKHAWLEEFGRQLTAADQEYFESCQLAPTALQLPKPRSAPERQAAIERAERALAAAGV